MPYKNSTGLAACAVVPLDMAAVLELRMPPVLLKVWADQRPRGLRVIPEDGLLCIRR